MHGFRLSKADSTEYEILRLNMEKVEADKEREAIRKVMVAMGKERAVKDIANKDFCESPQKRAQ